MCSKYFGSQCTPVQNSSSLPRFCLKTEKLLSSLNISEDDIFTIIKNLNSSKSYGWDDLSIKMMKLCSKSVAYPLKLMFETSFLGGEFPTQSLFMKKKGRIWWKITDQFFERVIFKDLFNYFHKNELFLSVSLVFYVVVLAFHSYFQLFMISVLHFTVNLHRMSGAYFWIFPKLLIKYGISGYCRN